MDEPHSVSRYHELEWSRSRTLDEVEKRIEAFSVFTSGTPPH
jgi:hypothetical protein